MGDNFLLTYSLDWVSSNSGAQRRANFSNQAKGFMRSCVIVITAEDSIEMSSLVLYTTIDICMACGLS